ncbi:MAG: alpha/beta hydrolase [Leptospirales bacterium]|nr:alpha/beta hydrolase [Leptospirales bacterium]
MILGPQKYRKSPVYIVTSILAIALLALAMGSAAVIIAVALVLMTLLYPIFLWIWERVYGADDIADQVFYAHTEDGWNLPLHFHRPSHPRPGAYPVILSHGIAANKFSVDLDRAHSLAYYLKRQGFPVFVVSLRGVGRSYHQGRTRYRDFNFDDIVQHDLPSIIATVRRLTGAPRVNWVGHSMGGMVMYGLQGRKLAGHEDVASFVAIGSPGRIDHTRRSLWGAVTRFPWVNELIDFRFGAQIVSPLTGRFTTPIEEMIFSKDNVSTTTIRKMMKNGVENISYGLANQFINWMRSGKELSVDGSFNYREGLRNIETPTLFLSGARDHVAIPESVRFAYERAGSKIKKYIELGHEQGLPVDYCHTGLVLGERAPEDVFPLVLDWLEQYGIERRRRGWIKRVFRRKKKGPRRARKFRDYRDSNRPSGVIQA